MAAYNKFEKFVEDLVKGVHNLTSSGTGNVKSYLSNGTPVATNSVKADIAEITAVPAGYAAGGPSVTPSVSRTGAVVTLVTVDIVITATGSTGPFRHVVHYNDTPTSPADPLIGWHDYGSPVTLATGETFTIDFGSNSLFTLT